MGILNFLKGQLLEIIEWTDDSRDTLSYRCLDEFADGMRSRNVSVFSGALAKANIPVLDVARRYLELGESLLPLINPVMTAKYGLEMTSFVVENVSLPPEVEQAIDKRSSMSAIGNLNDYVKFQMAQGMEKGGGPG